MRRFGKWSRLDAPAASILTDWLVLFFAVSLGCSGCASGNYGRSMYGTVGGYSWTNAKPTPPNLMVAQKIERPLFIVLDANKVKDTWPLETRACVLNSDRCERFNLMNVQTFVRRDLKTAMENYFSRVEVIDSPQALPAMPHVVADVKIDNIRLNDLVRGPLTYTLIEMTWGFAMRLSEQSEYAYSFAGTSVSNDSYPTFEAGCATLVENAIPSMLKKWTEEGGMNALRDAKP